jgi:protein O-GlcNAc transferase
MSTATIPQAPAAAMPHHQAGRLAEAEAIYRQILNVQPANADALHLLGVIASQTGHHTSAVDLIGRALQFQPGHGAASVNFGNALRVSPPA